jgi:hypothetical protein
METHKTFSIRLPDEVLKAMRELAEEHTRSLNGEILVALREYIKQQRQGLKPNTPNRQG